MYARQIRIALGRTPPSDAARRARTRTPALLLPPPPPVGAKQQLAHTQVIRATMAGRTPPLRVQQCRHRRPVVSLSSRPTRFLICISFAPAHYRGHGLIELYLFIIVVLCRPSRTLKLLLRSDASRGR